MPNLIGYEHVIRELKLTVTPVALSARVSSRVTAVTERAGNLEVPPSVAPVSDDPLSHLEFALKYQGIELETIQAACLAIDPALMQGLVAQRANGRYVRQIAALFEAFTGRSLDYPGVHARYIDLFDPDRYVCGVTRRMPKYRVNFNGLGSLSFCPTVRRTDTLSALLQRDLFEDLRRFVQSVGGSRQLDRALSWAYLDETRGSFEIEHENPSADKAQRFVQLLHQAHAGLPLTEAYLGELQSAVVTNPLLSEFAFRRQQNWLQRGARRVTASSITYLPPTPEALHGLMADFMDFANTHAPVQVVDPVIKAMLVSFGFVFLHPFMDGNGRISRFLVHHGLCRAGVLEEGLILPVSVAMKHHENDYLSALTSVSRPIRDLWQVQVAGEDQIHAQFMGNGDSYRYWDATSAVEFGIRMAHYALDHTLVEETQFLTRFDQVRREIEARYDLRDKELAGLIRMAHGLGGKLSLNRRKQYAATVQPEAMDAIEEAVGRIFFGL